MAPTRHCVKAEARGRADDVPYVPSAPRECFLSFIVQKEGMTLIHASVFVFTVATSCWKPRATTRATEPIEIVALIQTSLWTGLFGGMRKPPVRTTIPATRPSAARKKLKA